MRGVGQANDQAYLGRPPSLIMPESEVEDELLD